MIAIFFSTSSPDMNSKGYLEFKYLYTVHIQRYQNLSHKLWCYTRISSPEKSCNNTHEKIWFFLRVWYRQSAADTSIVFCTTWSGWWMNGKAFIILNPWSYVRIFFWLWLLKQWKISLLVFTCQLSSYGKYSKRNSIFTRSPCIILYLTYFTFWNVTQSSCNNTEKASA